jgi:hypothetical protein
MADGPNIIRCRLLIRKASPFRLAVHGVLAEFSQHCQETPAGSVDITPSKLTLLLPRPCQHNTLVRIQNVTVSTGCIERRRCPILPPIIHNFSILQQNSIKP